MRREYAVNLRSTSAVRFFVKLLQIAIKGEVKAYNELLVGKEYIDAKSVLDILEISDQPITVVYESEDLDEIEKFDIICNKYL